MEGAPWLDRQSEPTEKWKFSLSPPTLPVKPIVLWCCVQGHSVNTVLCFGSGQVLSQWDKHQRALWRERFNDFIVWTPCLNPQCLQAICWEKKGSCLTWFIQHSTPPFRPPALTGSLAGRWILMQNRNKSVRSLDASAEASHPDRRY